MRTAADLDAIGFSLVIFPGGIVRAIARTAEDYYASLKSNGTNTRSKNACLIFPRSMSALAQMRC